VKKAGGVGFWYCDLPFDVLEWDDTVKEHFHLAPNDHVTIDTFYERIFPGDRAATKTAIETSIANHEPYDVHYRTVDPKTGSQKWIRAIGRTFYSGDGTPSRFDGVTLDVTQKRRGEYQREFLSHLAGELQPLFDPEQISALTAKRLAEHLGVDRCAYAEVENESVYVITGDYTSNVPSITGRWNIGAFGTEHLRMMLNGESYVVDDADSDQRISKTDLAAYKATNIQAVICVPLLKEGKLTAAMAVHQTSPRRWTVDEIELVRIVVGRCWETLERARAHRLLRSNEEQLRLITDVTPGLIAFVDSEQRFKFANKQYEEWFETRRQDILGKSLWEVIGHDAYRTISTYVDRALSGERLEFEVYARYPNRSRHIHGAYVPRIEDGKVVGYHSLITDVTQHVEAQKQILESESRFRGLMEQAPISIQVLDPSGKTLMVNKAWEELWGLKLEHLVDYNVLTDEQLESKGIGSYLRRAFAGESVIIPEIEYDPNETIPTHSRHELPTRWVSAVAYPLKNSSGQIIEVVLIHSDITARKKAEQSLVKAHQALEIRVRERTAELARANEFMNALLENVQTGIIACDANGVLTLFNSVTRDLHGCKDVYLPAELWAQHYSLRDPDLGTPMSKEQIPLYRALQGERVQDAEMVIAPPGLDSRIVTTSGQAFYDTQGVKLGAVVSMQDITARKQNEAAIRQVQEQLERRVEERTNELARANFALKENDKRKDEFLATLAHELRNPLAPIYNALQILKLSEIGTEIWNQTREMMERQLNHLLRLVDELLDVSRVMQGKIQLRKEIVDLSDVVDQAIEMSRPYINTRAHELIVKKVMGSAPVSADPVRLSQILSNLLINAAKYTEPGGKIWISTQYTDRYAVLQVRDNGIGISPELLPRVFDLFVQADNATTKSQGGLGIGLTLVRTLVEIHGGSVEAYSDGLGKGSEFIVRLPVLKIVTSEPRVPIVSQSDLPKDFSHLRIMVVDDNKDAAVSLGMLLKLMGHVVTIAHSGVDALEDAALKSTEVVLLDIGMPGMDGYEVARKIRLIPELEKIVLIALTGWGQDEDRRRTAEAGFNYHLVKPLDQQELIKTLSTIQSNKVAFDNIGEC
jgi:PAS domain S-box-containing protein